MEIISVSGVQEVNTYIFTIAFFLGRTPQEDGRLYTGHFNLFPPIIGAEIYTDEDDDLDVLIGMDVISQGSLHVERSGFFSFWF